MIWLSRLGESGVVACGACDRVASCVLHNADGISTSSMVRFFCAHHLRSYLDAHPEYAEHLMDRLGTQGLYAFYDQQ